MEKNSNKDFVETNNFGSLDLIILRLIDLAAKDEYRSYIYGKHKHEFKAVRLNVPPNLTNTTIYGSIRKVNYLIDNGFESTMANYFLASALGVFKDE
jgi:hypothetical protein